MFIPANALNHHVIVKMQQYRTLVMWHSQWEQQYVCPKIYIRRTLSKKSQSRPVFIFSVLRVLGFSSAGQPSVGVFSENICSNWTCFYHVWLLVLISAAQYLWWTCTNWWFRLVVLFLSVVSLLCRWIILCWFLLHQTIWSYWHIFTVPSKAVHSAHSVRKLISSTPDWWRSHGDL